MAISAMAAWGQAPAYLDPGRDIEERVADALSRMTLEEKVALCHAQGKFSSPGVPRLGIPELWMSDGPHGVRAEVNWNDWGYAGWTSDSVTVFPALTCLSATWNRDMAAAYGRALGQEARYRRKDVLLGPGINIYRTPLGGRNFEYMGEDPYLSGEMCAEYIRGVQAQGVAACVKHFALNNQEEYRGNVDVELSDRALREIYLPAFERAVHKGGAWTIMGAYNKVRGQHCCHNDLLLNRILKGEWGFDGVVISDWGGAHDTREAALNGLDIEMGSFTNGLDSGSEFTYDDYFLARPFLEMVKGGKIDPSTVDDKARRILRLIMRTSMSGDRPFGSLCSGEHYDVARMVGTEGIVLLKNDAPGKGGSPLLPIDPQKAGSILVVGDNATMRLNEGGGSSDLKARVSVSPLDGLRESYGDRVSFARGYGADVGPAAADSLRAEAAALAARADLVIMVGGLNKQRHQDSEGNDRLGYGLPFGQDELIEALADANPNTVLVLLSGNAVGMPWVKRVPAIIQGWYLGSMGGLSLADIISGRESPSGKLPFSFPARLGDCGAHSFGEICYPGDGTREEYAEDILVGYRWHDTKGIPSLFPFGHGLSYTTFTYGKPALSSGTMERDGSITVTVPVGNSGTVSGKEVVQLYVGEDSPRVPRPVKELKGFEKVSLAPGEETEVGFSLTAGDLAYFDGEAGAWRADAGRYTLYIGSSSTDIRQKVTLELAE